MTVTPGQRQRLTIFDRVARAWDGALLRQGLQRATGVPEEYRCPLCTQSFRRGAAESGALTLEHVPAAAIGAVCVVLTCQRCNSTAGWKIDAHAATEELLREIDHAIRTGGTIARRRVRVTSFGETLNAIVWRDAGDAEVTISVEPSINNPAVHARYIRASEEAGAAIPAGETMHLSLPTLRWDPRLAQISDLKAAYLLAFARFGYWYAFDSALDIVRRQITVPDQKALASGFALRPTGEPVNEPQMLLMRSPIDALLVWVRRTPYLLPGLSMRADFYDTAQQVFGGDQPMTVTGQPVDLPQSLPMELDFADESRGT